MTRLTIVDLTPDDRRHVHAEQRADRRLHIDAVIALVVLVLLWVVGQVFLGDPPPVDPATTTLPAAVYVHPGEGP